MPEAPLRLLQLYPKGDFFTGAAIQLRDLAAALAARGHHVTIATPASAEWAERCRAAGLAHVAIPMHRPLDPRAAWRLARVIRAQRIQVAHAHKGRARTLAIFAGLLGGRTRLVLNRGVSFSVAGVRRVGYTSRRVDAIVAVCESIKRGLVAAGVRAAKVEVIYSGTDLERFHPGIEGTAIRRELGLSPADRLVTQVGVRSWRGWRDVVTAMATIAHKEPRARLLFVGVPAPRVAEIARQARDAGVEDRVLTLPTRTDVPAILAASDVVVDASYAGAGITGSIREALACERPVVATAVEGMPELVRDGETGRLVPPRDPAALAEAVLATLADPTAAQTMARAGRKRVEAHFSLRAKVDATEALYRRLASA
ncbi:MAG TPA: glycosyltransferase family 4 protein [Methylomirabilota bacterium]|jgi:glycosyltransferase involved in cell wall biosynthesis|nr:glycosyltransferase family 4 protein [Methylomirabilota bacterium]